MLILSICIPSHNRFYLLENTLKSIFESKSEEFEVVVVDNGSTEDIREKIKINDPRLRIVKREKTVVGTRSVNECVKFAKGKYAFLCLDKDGIIGENLSDFIEALKVHPEIWGGYCTLSNYNSLEIVEICHDKVLKHFGYLRKHPTGDFYRTDCIKAALNKMTREELECTWGYDLLLAECASRGNMMQYNRHMVYSAGGKKEFLRILSYTFSPNTDNLFFCPGPIIRDFHIFLHHLVKLPVSVQEKQKMFFHLYRRTMSNITIDYRQEMMNKDVCTHYHTISRYVPGKELLYWWKKFICDIRKTDCTNLGMSEWYKNFICFGLNVGFLIEKGKCFFK